MLDRKYSHWNFYRNDSRNTLKCNASFIFRIVEYNSNSLFPTLSGMALSFTTDKERLERRGEERRGEVTRPVTKLKGERKTGLTRGAFHHRDYGDEVVNGVKKNERHPITRARSRRYQYPSNVTRHGGSRPIRDLLNSYPSSLDIWSFLKQKEDSKEGSKEGSARNRCIDGRKR